MHALPFLAVIFLVFFSGCLDILFTDPHNAQNTPVACEAFTDLASKDSCFRDRAVNDKNPDACLSVSPSNRDTCYSGVADALDDGRVCLRMSAFEPQIPCVDAHKAWLGNGTACESMPEGTREICSRHAARVLKNEAFCYASGSQKNACLTDVAKVTNNPDVCDLIGDADGREACFVATAVNAKNSGACQKIVALEPRESCLDQVAVAQGNATLCESIQTPSLRAGCLARVQSAVENSGSCGGMADIPARDNCFKGLAQSTKQVDTCKRIIGQATRDDCYSALALAIRDDTICLSIVSDDAKRQACLSAIATSGGTALSCDVLSGSAHDACVEDVAVRTKDASLCLQLKVVTNLVDYADDCFAKVAKAKVEYTTCLNVRLQSGREACLRDVGILGNNETACGQIVTPTLREDCYAGVAAGLKKSQVCENIQTKVAHDECIKKVALATKSADICEGITDTLTQDACYSEVSIVLKDKSICDKIVNKTQKDPCVLSIAIALNDWKYCEKISSSNPEIEQSCLTQIAGRIGSVEPCTLVAAQVKKGLCYGMAGLTGANFTVCSIIPLKQVVDPIEAHLARDTCWNYIATRGNGADLCDNIYDTNLMRDCSG